MNVFPSVYERAAFGKFYDKLADTFLSLSDILAGKAPDPTHRITLMFDSLHMFQDYPVFGVGLGARGIDTEGVGGHSSWIDALAFYGVLGGVPYLLFHVLVGRRLWLVWRSDRQNALFWGCLLSCALYLFYGFFNVVTQGTTVALFLYATAPAGSDRRFPRAARAWSWSVPRQSADMRVLWFCNCPLNDADAGGTGSWLGAMARAAGFRRR